MNVDDGTPTFTYFLVGDNENVIALADDDGEITDRYEYSTFGELQSHTGSDPNRILFSGEPADQDSGLVYLRHRYYEPSAGKFLSREPLSTFGINGFNYCGNNPIGKIDPFGWKEEQIQFRNPVDSKSVWHVVTERYPYFNDRLPHYGIDIRANIGDPVYAPTGGRVTLIRQHIALAIEFEVEVKGTMIKKWICLAHLKEIKVCPGQKVKMGQKIAEIGPFIRGGRSMPHLHLQIATKDPSKNSTMDMNNIEAPLRYFPSQDFDYSKLNQY